MTWLSRHDLKRLLIFLSKWQLIGDEAQLAALLQMV